MALVRARRLVWETLLSDHLVACHQGDYYKAIYSDSVAYTGYKLLLPNDRWSPASSIQNACDMAQDIIDSKWLADMEVLPLEWEQHPNLVDFKQSGIYRVAKTNPNQWSLLIYCGPASSHPTEQSAIDAANEHNRKTILGE